MKRLNSKGNRVHGDFKKWYKTNKDKELVRHKKDYQANRQYNVDRVLAYAKLHPEWWVIQCKKHYLKVKMGVLAGYGFLDKDGDCYCEICGRKGPLNLGLCGGDLPIGGSYLYHALKREGYPSINFDLLCRSCWTKRAAKRRIR